MGIGVIAELTVREAARRRILTAALLVGVAFLALYGIGLYLITGRTSLGGGLPGNVIIRRAVLTMLMTMGLYAVNWLAVVMTILTSVDTLAGEISSGTIQSVVSKPLRRTEVVLGKWLGFAVMLTAYLVALAGGVLLELWWLAGFRPSNIAGALALMWLEMLVLLAVTFRAGAALSTLATGVAVFGLHVLAFLGGWVEEIGSLVQSQTAVNIGIVVSLIIPSESMWRLASSQLQGPVTGAFGRSPFTVSSVPSQWMMVYALLYLLVALVLALRTFSRRDL
jgi:ABC-type transport system involved in multi-copper enzyme maturation permease subunit